MSGGCGLAAEESGRGTKRPIPDGECVEDNVAVTKKPREGHPEPTREKTSQPEGEHDLNLPLPWESGMPCLVKVCHTE